MAASKARKYWNIMSSRNYVCSLTYHLSLVEMLPKYLKWWARVLYLAKKKAELNAWKKTQVLKYEWTTNATTGGYPGIGWETKLIEDIYIPSSFTQPVCLNDCTRLHDYLAALTVSKRPRPTTGNLAYVVSGARQRHF